MSVVRMRSRARIRRTIAVACAALTGVVVVATQAADPWRHNGPVACPAMTPAAPLTAPTHVEVLAGNGSATVTWCAPDHGAGSVVSRTTGLPYRQALPA
jgi:hypothetical protein